jgi:RimJ/RimL family protein N-acetyltransferase
MESNKIEHPVSLHGQIASLVPLEEKHFDEICRLANDPSIWKFSPIGVNGADQPKHMDYLNKSLEKRSSGEWYPFVILEKKTGSMAGCTMFHTISYENRSLEIGGTWLHPQHWATGINTECKYLLLCYCFEKLNLIRVQLKANENNARSRKAIEKMGAQFEGVLRKDKILEDGSLRYAAYYSILDDEWEAVKLNLEQTLKNKWKQ